MQTKSGLHVGLIAGSDQRRAFTLRVDAFLLGGRDSFANQRAFCLLTKTRLCVCSFLELYRLETNTAIVWPKSNQPILLNLLRKLLSQQRR